METEAQQTSRYIGGLHLAMQDKVNIQTAYTMVEVVNLVTRVKMQMDKQGIKHHGVLHLIHYT